MNPIFWLVCLTLVCCLPFISFVSYFDIIWPTCLLSYPVCSTLCLSAFVFVFMFTEREDVFVLLCLLLLFSEEVCCCTCRDQTREELCLSQNVPISCYTWNSTERKVFLNKYMCSSREGIQRNSKIHAV